MRNLVVGMIVGLVMGSTMAAAASYIGKPTWDKAPGTPITQTFHLGYVAGVVDTVQALKRVSYFPRQSLAEGLDRIDQCTQDLNLGQAVERAEAAVSSTPSTDSAADAILGDFMKCQ